MNKDEVKKQIKDLESAICRLSMRLRDNQPLLANALVNAGAKMLTAYELADALADFQLKPSGKPENPSFYDLVEALEEAAVLLAEVHVRFGGARILDADMQEEEIFTYGDAGIMFNELAKKASDT